MFPESVSGCVRNTQGDKAKKPGNRKGRDIAALTDTFQRVCIFKFLDDESHKLRRHAMIPRDKGVLFIEAFAAAGAYISSLSIVIKNKPFSQRWALQYLHSVIVY
jgi:hypothetical protein